MHTTSTTDKNFVNFTNGTVHGGRVMYGLSARYQGVIFIVDHRFYRVPPYICCENDRKRSIVVCAEIPEDFRTLFLHKRLFPLSVIFMSFSQQITIG
jgi:hypothetical protein